MVLKRRIDYGFTGYSASNIPRARRSVRKRSLHKKTVEDGQLCAFDLLATVAGKLLQESESSSTASCAAMGIDQYEACLNAIEPEKLGMDNPVRTENDDQGSSEESGFYSGLCLQSSDNKGTLKETASETVAENGSNVASSASSGKSDSDVKPITPKSGDKSVKIHCKVEEDIPKWGETFSITTEDGGIKQSEFSVQMDEDLTATNKFSDKDSADLFRKFPAGATCNKNLEFPVCKDTPPSPSLFRYRNDVKIGGRDDDEILSRSQLNAKARACGPPARVGDRIRKLLTSKYWKVGPKLKESEPSNSGTKLKHNYNDRKSWYSHAQSECVTPFKKRKLFDHSSGVSFDGGISSQSVSNCPEKHTEDRKNGSAEKFPEGKNASASNMGHQRSFNSRNSPVKFTIKSFKVPELFIEVPESTTVGSLKRTVLEAVTAIIGDGLRVGVFLEGKKIRDDNKTLLQSGISQNDNLDSLGFMLEPISPRSPSLSPEGPLAPLKCVSPKDVKRTQVFSKESSFPGDRPNKSLVTDSECQGGGNQELIPAPAADELESKTAPDSKALVPVSEANIEALAIVSSSHRPKRSEIGQRRTRRPFSVSEVEALVQAVEKLGTGRWRDVKLCAFENAKHRTYVDLKDKWKTLVHTARISPQQRRGEPVPQELLDRVLAAHALWSQHQAKQHGKQQQQPGLLRLTDNLAPNGRAAAA